MFNLFGFNPQEFSDEELADRITDLAKRMVWFARMGQTSVAGQLQAQRNMCEQEQRERIAQGRAKILLQMEGVVVETDPDLAQEAKAKRDAKAEEDAAATKKPRQSPFIITKERLIPTRRPTSDE